MQYCGCQSPRHKIPLPHVELHSVSLVLLCLPNSVFSFFPSLPKTESRGQMGYLPHKCLEFCYFSAWSYTVVTFKANHWPRYRGFSGFHGDCSYCTVLQRLFGIDPRVPNFFYDNLDVVRSSTFVRWLQFGISSSSMHTSHCTST